MTCRLEAGDWLYIPSGWWHIARTQTASIHLSIGVMPVTRLALFDFLSHRLAHSPFWCERLALVSPEKAGSLVLQESDEKTWADMRSQLAAILAQEETFQAFLAYLVDTKRARNVESPAFRLSEAPPSAAAPFTVPPAPLET
jgi:ribosomal protein L16 Arg81 hydroxylase